MELSAWKLKLEESERALARRERALNIQGSKVHYKKKLPKLGGSAAAPCGADRFRRGSNSAAAAVAAAAAAGGGVAGGGVFSVQGAHAQYRARNTSPSTPEVLSTSPESPFKLPEPAAVLAADGDDATAAAAMAAAAAAASPAHRSAVVRVRENPCFAPHNSPEHFLGAEGVDWSMVHRVGGGNGGGITRGPTTARHFRDDDFNANTIVYPRVRELWDRV